MSIEIDRQHLADGRVQVAALAERFLAAEHEQAAAAATDELLEERKLVLLEEAGLDVVENDGVVAKQGVGILRKAAAELFLVFRAQANQHRLIVLLGRVVGLVAKAAKERVGSLAAAAQERELWLALGDSHQAAQIDLVVLLDRSPQEFEFPIGPAADIEHAIGPAAAIDGG